MTLSRSKPIRIASIWFLIAVLLWLSTRNVAAQTCSGSNSAPCSSLSTFEACQEFFPGCRWASEIGQDYCTSNPCSEITSFGEMECAKFCTWTDACDSLYPPSFCDTTSDTDASNAVTIGGGGLDSEPGHCSGTTWILEGTCKHMDYSVCTNLFMTCHWISGMDGHCAVNTCDDFSQYGQGTCVMYGCNWTSDSTDSVSDSGTESTDPGYCTGTSAFVGACSGSSYRVCTAFSQYCRWAANVTVGYCYAIPCSEHTSSGRSTCAWNGCTWTTEAGADTGDGTSMGIATRTGTDDSSGTGPTSSLGTGTGGGNIFFSNKGGRGNRAMKQGMNVPGGGNGTVAKVKRGGSSMSTKQGMSVPGAGNATVAKVKRGGSSMATKQGMTVPGAGNGTFAMVKRGGSSMATKQGMTVPGTGNGTIAKVKKGGSSIATKQGMNVPGGGNGTVTKQGMYPKHSPIRGRK